jgi:signal transduction histidine kinase
MTYRTTLHFPAAAARALRTRGRDRALLAGARRANGAVGLAVAVVLVALVLLAVLLHGEQNSARRSLISRFDDRAGVMSALTQAVLSSASGSATLQAREFGSPTVSGELLDRTAAQGEVAYAALLDTAKQVIAASRDLSSFERADLLASPALTPVLGGAPVSVSNVLPAANQGAGVVDLAISLNTAAGRRILVEGIPTRVMSAFLSSYLRRVPTPGGASYVLDSNGKVVGASNPQAVVGQPLAKPGLIDAAQQRPSGPYGSSRYFVAVSVPDSTWRIVITSSDQQLFGTVSGSHEWLPWVIYGALVILAVGFLALLWRLLGTTRALTSANDELEVSNRRLESSNALLRHAAELSRSNAELEQFASIASHDLQEPLRKVQTFAAQLVMTEQERLSDEGQDYLQRMSAAASRMRQLIDDLLTFSRVTTRARPFVPVDLGEVAEEVLVDLEVSIEESGAQVVVGELPTVQADPVQMRQLMQNLLTNALKFRRQDLTLQITVSAHVDDHVAEVTVNDNGIGFDEQYATRIFRAFERLHGARTYPGTGIGLALCRKIVERHNGTIVATSQIDQGATFTIRLPVTQPIGTGASTTPYTEPATDQADHVLV